MAVSSTYIFATSLQPCLFLLDTKISSVFWYVDLISLSDTDSDPQQDSAVIQDPDGDGKIVYLFLPLYKVGCHSLRLLHPSHGTKKGNLQDAINAHSVSGTKFSEREILRFFKGMCEAVRAMHAYHPGTRQASTSAALQSGEVLDHHGDNDEDGASVPLVAQQHKDAGDTIFDGDEEASALDHSEQGKNEVIPYAHRDLKPA
jgi:serine/threonine kinase 16